MSYRAPAENEMKSKDSASMQPGEKKIIHAGISYMVLGVLEKGISFITLPIFTRILSKAEYGIYSNILSWYSVLSILATLSLSSSMIRARHDYESDLNRYCSSILLMGSGITTIFLLIFIINLDFFCELFGIPASYLLLIMVALLFIPANSLFTTLSQLTYKTRSYAVFSFSLVLTEAAMSLCLMLLLEDKLAGRIIGLFLPQAIFSICLYTRFLVKGRGFKFEYCRYAFVYCLPIVPHLLSAFVLSQSDRLMLYRMCGSESTAMYSIAASICQIVVLLWSSMNSAFSPWLGDMIHSNNTAAIRGMSKKYICTFVAPFILILLLAPEIILIIGGKQYMPATEYIVPLLLGSAYQFFYTLYVNIEQYEKKNWNVTIGTFGAGAINITLNLILIPKFGPVAAAYTTLIGYLCLLVFHVLMVKRIGFSHAYDGKFVFTAVCIISIFAFLIQFLYRFTLLRWLIAVLYAVAVCAIVFSKYPNIAASIKKKFAK